MPKLCCPHCNKTSEFIDTGVGWKCPNCTGHVFMHYKDKDGVVHKYTDPDIRRKTMMEESHIYDMDPFDVMVTVTEPGPFYSPTMESFTPTFMKLAKLADELDEKGLKGEADVVDQFLQENKKKDPQTMKDKTYVDLKFFPYDDVYSLSGEPMSNL